MSHAQITPEDKVRYMEVMAGYDEARRQEAIKIGQRKAADHHTTCRDCGKFTDKSRWVLKESTLAIERNLRPLCIVCLDEYDCDY